MISPPPSPTFTTLRSISGKPYTKNENPALSPKRPFAQLKEDHLSQPELKRRHGAQPSKRAPLDPLSVSDLENRSNGRGAQSSDSASYHSLVTPSSLAPDLRVWHPEQPLSSGLCGMRRSSTSGVSVCSWPPPPPTPVPSAGRSSHNSLTVRQALLHSSGESKSTRDTFLEPISTWCPPDSSQTEPTTTMTNPTRTTEWKSENVLQPIRSRTNSMPSVRRPPEELWRSGSGPTKVAHELVDNADSLVCPTPPGLPPRRPELRRSGSVSELLSHGSVSLSLALGSQPLSASEHMKAVPPIGAERSRVVSITSGRIRNSPVTETNDPASSPWCSSPPSPTLDAEWKNETYPVDTSSLGKVQAEACYASVSREDLERLLRHAARNKYAPKIASPLSPLRTITPAFDLSVDPACRLHMPTPSNNLSSRYSKCPPRRVRTVCDGYQSFNLDTTCMHCQECIRDTVGKRLLAFRYRQRQTHHVQRNKLLAYPARGASVPVVDDDPIVLANRIREVFSYEVDDEEKSLWEEVAAVTGGGPLPFSRAGTPCAAAAAHWRVMDDGSDDGTRDDGLEIPDEGLLANEFTLLFRDVSVSVY